MTSYADFHRRSIEDRDGFWTEQAQLIDWHKPFDQVCDYSKPPFANWFAGGETNLCYNAVDRHLATRPDQNALIFVSTETDIEKLKQAVDVFYSAGIKRFDFIGGEVLPVVLADLNMLIDSYNDAELNNISALL